MSWLYRKTDGTEVPMNLKAVEGADDLEREVMFPLAEVKTPDHAATQPVTIKQKETFLQPGELTGNSTINLTIDDQVTIGAKLHLKLDADGSNRTVTLGTGFDAGLASIVVTASKVAFATFIYDGTAFVPAWSNP